MKIGFDGKRAVSNMTGLGNYSRLVIEGLAKYRPDDSLIVYTPKLRENPRLSTLHYLENIKFSEPQGKGVLSKGSLWRSFGISRDINKDDVTLFHGLSNELPLNIIGSGIPSVVTIHDVIYRRLPYCYNLPDRIIYDYKYGKSCKNANRIIAVSECTKRDIMHYYGIPEEKIEVVYQGCDNIFRKPLNPEDRERIKKTYGLPDNYILQVGSVEKRKNIELTIRSMVNLPKELKLVAVGGGGEYKKKMKQLTQELGLTERVIWLEGVPFTDLPPLNRNAAAIAYPSFYEGFGIPVLEGLESERPVVAATGSCLEEAGGPDSIYVDPNSVREMSEALNAILKGSADTKRMISEGKRYAKRFNIDDMAENIHNVYSKTLSEL